MEVRVKGSEKALKDFNEIDIIRLMFLKDRSRGGPGGCVPK